MSRTPLVAGNWKMNTVAETATGVTKLITLTWSLPETSTFLGDRSW